MNRELLVCGNIARDIIYGQESFGGCASTIAINAVNLGLSSGLVSVVGKDAFSKLYTEFLVNNHICIDLVENSLEKLPECVISAGNGSGDNIEWIDYGSHSAMESMRVDLRQALNYSLVHLVSCPPGFSNKMANLGIQNLSFEPGPYIHVNSTCLDFVVIDKSKLLFFNEDEYRAALQITGYKSPEDFVGGSRRILVVTKGEKGSDIFIHRNMELISEHIEAIDPGSPVIDTTGAGDCFKAGFLAGYIHGKTLRDCALIGSYMGAMCVSQEGAILSADRISLIRKMFRL